MKLNKREKYIGIGVGAAIAIFALDRYALTPYAERSKQLDIDRAAVMNKSKAADLTFARKNKLEKTWKDLRAMMKTDNSEADSQARTVIRECAEAAGVVLSPINAERSPQSQEGFRVISLKVSVTGRTASISRMLWHLETTSIPLRISDLELTAKPENSDELKLDLTVSTLATPVEKAPTNAVALGGTR